jgi:hypothetical protein
MVEQPMLKVPLVGAVKVLSALELKPHTAVLMLPSLHCTGPSPETPKLFALPENLFKK